MTNTPPMTFCTDTAGRGFDSRRLHDLSSGISAVCKGPDGPGLRGRLVLTRCDGISEVECDHNRQGYTTGSRPSEGSGVTRPAPSDIGAFLKATNL